MECACLDQIALALQTIPREWSRAFRRFFAQLPETPGHAALLSQSGAFGGYAAMAARSAGLSFSCWMTTGNEADIELADGLAYFAEDPNTRVVLAYMEGCRNGPKLIEALRLCHETKTPVVMMKVGRTDVGAAAAASHTASLAGADEVYDGIFQQYNVYRANSLDEWLDVGRAAARGVYPRSNRVALITASGGVGVFMADEAQACGLDVPAFDADTQAEVRRIIAFAGTRNPVDVTGQALSDITLFERTIKTITRTQAFDSIVSFHAGIGQAPVAGRRLQEAWARVRSDHPDILVAVSGASTPELDAAYEASSCLAFQDPGRAVRAIGSLGHLAKGFSRDLGQSDVPLRVHPALKGPLSESDALSILGNAGISVVPHRLARSREEARAAADALGYPVVLKIVSPDILHKTEIGGVILSLPDGVAVEAAYSTLLERATKAAPAARIEGCLVAPMVKGGFETILGVQRDPVFGPVVMFGLGGIFVEILRDLSFRAAPFDETEAIRMIEATHASIVLRGVRGAGAFDIPSLARSLSNLSRFAAAHPEIASIDINPFVVLPQGAGACALDAVIVIAHDESRA